jgi:RND family efflux transporter MFP subunit
LLFIAAVGTMLYYRPWVPSATEVVLETATARPILRVLAVNGRIAALHSVDVRSSVSGTMASLPIVEGASVRLGDVLARINPQAQEAVVRQSRAALDSGRVTQAQADADFKRLSALKGIVARTTIEAAQSKARAADEEVRRLAALFDQALIQLAKFVVRAPITGTVMSISGEPGQLVDPAMAFVTLADLAQLIVEVDVDETYATQIHVGQPALMKLAGESGTVEGQVSFVAGRVDAASGGLAVNLAFRSPQSAPLGLTVTANIVVDRQEAALSVPRTAILMDEEGTAVFEVIGGIARRKPVVVIDWPAERLIVRQGLEAGDIFIADSTGIAEGAAVKAVQP